jgi:MoxR-like ATPase
MEEHQVTVDGATWALPDPFFCIATQNPHGQIGTFPLPESQLDRFALALSMGLPGRDAERQILLGHGGLDAFAGMGPVTDPTELARVVATVHRVWCAPPLVDYVLDLIDETRRHPQIAVGASPRAAVGLLQAARAHAVTVGRMHVQPDDVQAVAAAALAHRISLGGVVDTAAARVVVSEIVARLPVPRP